MTIEVRIRGPQGSGKTTLAELVAEFAARGRKRVSVVDGDGERRGPRDADVAIVVEQTPAGPDARTVDFVFDGPPGPEGPRFVEVESPPGTPVRFGEWVDRRDGTWAVRFRREPEPPASPWRPIAELAAEPERLVIARTGSDALDHVMVWRSDFLLGAMSPRTPSHLRFDATEFMEVPE